MTKHRFAGYFASVLITLSIVNDALILGVAAFSWAKLLFLSACLVLALGRFKNFMLKKIEVLLICYCLSMIIITIFLSGGGIGDRFFNIAVSFFIGFLSFIVLTRSSVRLADLKKMFLFWMAISVSVGIVQSLTGQFYFTSRIFTSTIIPGLYRASGFMSDPNYFSLLCLISCVLTLDGKNKIFKAFHLYFFLGVLLTGSRSGLLCYFLLLVFSRFDNIFNFRKAMLATILFLVFSFVLYFLKDFLPQSIAMIFDASSYTDVTSRNSLSDRTAAIVAGFNAFVSNPIFGYGIGNLTQHPLNHHGQMSHNTFVEIAAENGLFGIIMYISLNFFLMKMAKKRHVDVIDPIIYKEITMLVIVLNMMAMTIVIHYSRIFFFVLALVTLIISDASRREKND